MEFSPLELRAAHDLGEAILRFVHAVQIPNRQQPSIPSSQMDENRLVRVAEAAKILSLSRSKIYGLMDSGRLPSVKIDSAKRIKLGEVLKLLDGTD